MSMLNGETKKKQQFFVILIFSAIIYKNTCAREKYIQLNFICICTIVFFSFFRFSSEKKLPLIFFRKKTHSWNFLIGVFSLALCVKSVIGKREREKEAKNWVSGTGGFVAWCGWTEMVTLKAILSSLSVYLLRLWFSLFDYLTRNYTEVCIMFYRTMMMIWYFSRFIYYQTVSLSLIHFPSKLEETSISTILRMKLARLLLRSNNASFICSIFLRNDFRLRSCCLSVFFYFHYHTTVRIPFSGRKS